VIGQKLGPYEIVAKLGEGGMGEVYAARDTRLDRRVAIKVVSEAFARRFEREGRALAAINHPNICTIHDVGPNYLVMELVDGQTLRQALQTGPLPIADVMRYGGQIAGALAAAHAHGIVHRDLKPGNIMVAGGNIKVLDFGIATY
jgi:serine/threonine protein kinase